MGVWNHCFENEDKAKLIIKIISGPFNKKNASLLYPLIGCDKFWDEIKPIPPEEDISYLIRNKVLNWLDNLNQFNKFDPKAVKIISNYIKKEKLFEKI